MSDFTIGSVRPARQGSLRAAFATVGGALHDMLRARRTRRMLADMDDRLLADIGVGRGEALDESRRPMWDLARRPR